MSHKVLVTKVELMFLPNRLEFTGVSFDQGNKNSTLIEVTTPRIIFNFSIVQLFHRVLKIRKISIEQPIFTVSEGDQRGGHLFDDEYKSSFKIEIDQINIHLAEFTYHRNHLSKMASIHLTKIDGVIDLRNPIVKARATALLEGMGSVILAIDSPIFEKGIKAEVSLDLSHMDLNLMNAYFIPNSGTSIRGTLTHGLVITNLLGQSVKTRVDAEYDSLKIEFSETMERGKLKTIVSNLFSGVKPKKNRARIAQTQRDIEEPLIGFIFRGMKDAALKVATD